MTTTARRPILAAPILAALILGGAASSPALANKVFVSNERGNSVSVLDSETWEKIAEFPAGNRPRGITMSPDGRRLYVCASDDDTVRVFDPDTYAEIGTLPSGPDPELFVLHPSGNPLYIANEDDNLVTVVDVESRAVLAEVPVGVEPEGMALSARRPGADQHLRDHQHGAFHRHRELRDHPQRAGRSAPALCRVLA